MKDMPKNVLRTFSFLNICISLSNGNSAYDFPGHASAITPRGTIQPDARLFFSLIYDWTFPRFTAWIDPGTNLAESYRRSGSVTSSEKVVHDQQCADITARAANAAGRESHESLDIQVLPLELCKSS
jgi:hypothetical protein